MLKFLVLAVVVAGGVKLLRSPGVRCVFEDAAGWSADRLGLSERNLSYQSISRRILRRMVTQLVVGVSKKVLVPAGFVIRVGTNDWQCLGNMTSFVERDLRLAFGEQAKRNDWQLPGHDIRIDFRYDPSIRAGYPVVIPMFDAPTPAGDTMVAKTDSGEDKGQTYVVVGELGDPHVTSRPEAAPEVTPEVETETDDRAVERPSVLDDLPTAGTKGMERFSLISRDPGVAPSIAMSPAIDSLEVGRAHQPGLGRISTVSATHCRLEFDGTSWHINDCGSRHGLLVNGQATDSRALELGDTIQLGSAGPRFVLEQTLPTTV